MHPRRVALLILFFAARFTCSATHIVGGELMYDHIGKEADGRDIYRITLKVYRDCLTGIGFDTPTGQKAILTVQQTLGALTGTFDIGAPVITKVPPTINNPCLFPHDSVCVEEGVYTFTISLTPVKGGYYLTYQRCCRNHSINNMVNPDEQGSTYYSVIPGPENAAQNSSPRFNKFPPIYICANQPFVFDHSAVDPDGDSLVYGFYTPFMGLDGCCSAIGAVTSGSCGIQCPSSASPPPYTTVTYVSPFTGSYPLPASPAFTIHPYTGLVTGKPTTAGQYVVGISISEYRGGQLINRHYRDFQFNVTACLKQVVSAMHSQSQLCAGSSVTFTNLSTSTTGPPQAAWDFGVAGTSTDTSTLYNPAFNFPNYGTYTVTLVASPGSPCADTVRKVFFIFPELDVRFNPQSFQCLQGNSFTFQAQGNYHSTTTFTWNFSSAAVPEVTAGARIAGVVFNRSAVHIVTLEASHFDCRDSFSDTVRVVGLPPGAHYWDTSIVIGRSLTLNADAGAGFTYTWLAKDGSLMCAGCNDPTLTIKPLETTTYSVHTEDYKHCGITPGFYKVRVLMKASLDVPSAFTPNGDGINDVIFPDGWAIRRLLYFRVYNRWGQLLFETAEYGRGWDGRYNGVMQNNETYVFQVAAETYLSDPGEITRTGTFTLLR